MVGEGDALGDEVIATADEGAEGTGLIGEGQQGAEAVAIGPEQIAEQVGVAGVALAASGRVAGAAGLHGIGVDRDDREAGVQEGIDDEAGGALEGDGQPRRGARSGPAAGRARPSSRCGVGHRPAPADGAGLSCPAHKQRAWWRPSPSRRRRTLRASLGLRDTAAGEACRSLTDWRSGFRCPWRFTLWPVGASLGVSRGSRSHTGRHAASRWGSPRLPGPS